MKGTRKDRRSRRVPAIHRMLLTILGPNGSEIAKEIVSTVELSRFGARLRGRRSFRPEAEGLLTLLRSGRQARVRVVWQSKTTDSSGYMDTGVEILSGFDYWGAAFAEVDPAEAAAPESGAGSAERSALAIQDVLTELADRGPNERNLETLWSVLIENLEGRKVITRDDLIAAIRNIAKLSKADEVSDARA
jgi:hypothetical protein